MFGYYLPFVCVLPSSHLELRLLGYYIPLWFPAPTSSRLFTVSSGLAWQSDGERLTCMCVCEAGERGTAEPHVGMRGAKYGRLLYKYSAYITVYTKSKETLTQPFWQEEKQVFCTHYQPTARRANTARARVTHVFRSNSNKGNARAIVQVCRNKSKMPIMSRDYTAHWWLSVTFKTLWV